MYLLDINTSSIDAALIAVLAEAPGRFSCACGGIVPPMGIPVLVALLAGISFEY
jgi:hypothetical protein